jgi:hypothetical protein
MKSPVRITLFVLVLTALLLAACAPGAPATSAPADIYQAAVAATAPPAATQAPGDVYAVQPPQEAAPQTQKSGVDSGAATNALPENATIQTGTDALTGVQSDHMIIKNADVKLLVENTDNAIDRSMQVVGDVNGYIISSRVWYQTINATSYKFATISIGVPVTEFETAMRRLRGLAVRVLDENASGQDVTSEYVDLQSQLGNLEVTRDRIRSFLDNAKTVEESLTINQELTNIEGQIDQVKGRMNFLSNRSAFSTITVTIKQDIPALTPTPTPTAEPTATPKVWSPNDSIHGASDAVTNAYHSFVEIGIWLFMFIIPLLAPPALIFWGIYKLATRKAKKTEPTK